LTDPEIYATVLANVRKELEKNPSINIFSISQTDVEMWCKCPNCSKIAEEEGSVSGVWLRFLNKIAEELEDEYDCDLDSYHDLVDSDDPDEDHIRNFDFDFSGARTYMIALTTTYADLADAFNAYAPGTYLDPWRMRPGSYISPATLRKIDLELIGLPEGPSRYFCEEQ
jgi:hypothetical protein